MTRDPSEETTVVALYPSRHEAEIGKSFLADQGIHSFVTADDVHVPLQLSEGARLIVMQQQAQAALQVLTAAELLPDGSAADVYPGAGDDEEMGLSEDTEERRASRANPYRNTVAAITATLVVVVVLFFIPWRIDRTEEIRWAPVYRVPISQADTFREVGTVQVYYETGTVAFDILLLQVGGLIAAGLLASMAAGFAAQADPV